MAVTVNINGIGSINFPTGVSSATVLDGQLTINLTGGSGTFNGVNHQAGTSYTFVNGDNVKLVTFNNAGAVAVTLPNASTLSANWVVFVMNLGAGAVTITPSVGTIDGLAALPSLSQYQGVVIFSDNTNYFSERGVGSSGGVTSVGLSMPAEFTVTGSPVTTSGTLAVTKANQSANQVYAGPASGGAAAPGFRALVPADYPVFVASGASHAAGAVPDPGAVAGTTRFLREDATWQVPAGGGSSPSRTSTTLSGGSLLGVASGAVVKGSQAMFKSFQLLQVSGVYPFRLRLYSTQAARDMDAGTSNGVAPDRPNWVTPTVGYNHGVIADLYLPAATLAFAGVLTSATGNGTTVTYNITNNVGAALTTGISVKITGFQTAGFNGTFTIQSVTGSPPTAFTVNNTTNTTETPTVGLAIAQIPSYLRWNMSPIALGDSDDATVSTTIYWAITNLDTVSRNMSVTMTYLQEES